MLKFSALQKLAAGGALAVALLAAVRTNAQNLTLEGQTGGFITPTAYVVYTEKDHIFSHPAVGYHFVNASKVIGYVHTFSIEEGVANRFEFGYTRNVHTKGNDPSFSGLWNYSGMNVFNAKIVGIKDGQFGPWTPGIGAGFVVRTNDRFVSGALNQAETGSLKSYTNGDVYVAVTKTWLHPPVPFLVNIGWKATNASIYGLGGQATRFGGRLFGGLGIPLPLGHNLAAVPAVGFTQEPPQVVNLSALLVNSHTYAPGAPAHIPTTMDYAVRVTQKDNPHFAFDIGVGHVAGVIGDTAALTPQGPVLIPIDLKANAVVGMGLSIRY